MILLCLKFILSMIILYRSAISPSKIPSVTQRERDIRWRETLTNGLDIRIEAIDKDRECVFAMTIRSTIQMIGLVHGR